ncbi:ribonuclease Z [Tissierella praeacuta]|uniref:ribonuclease Z n=1 Tax=Tissierella praeacuta TaxID=43131 RepID=UPI00333F3045
MIDITLLGTGGGLPMPNRFLSSTIISYKGSKILMDCGEGTQVSMRNLKTGFKHIDIICLTHVHGDHIFGLPGLLSTIGNSGRTEPITIVGPRGIFDVVRGLILSIPYLPYTINIIESPRKPLNIQSSDNIMSVKEDSEKSLRTDIILSAVELEHSSPCLGYNFYIKRKPKFYPEKAEKYEVPKEIWKKLQNGEIMMYNNKTYTPDMVLGEERKGIKISYITDTRPIDRIIDFINESNLFICEGTYGDNEDLDKAIKNKHMLFSEAAELAYKGNVEELLLTHFSPSMDEPELYKVNAINVFSNTVIGYDGFAKKLNFT